MSDTQKKMAEEKEVRGEDENSMVNGDKELQDSCGGRREGAAQKEVGEKTEAEGGAVKADEEKVLNGDSSGPTWRKQKYPDSQYRKLSAEEKRKSFRVPDELLPPNAVDITFGQTGKLWKVPIHPGDENITLFPRQGSLAWIHYKSWLATDPEKKIFDSSSLYQDDQDPVAFNIGEKQVIRAIDFGVGTMTKKGERALFIAHYDFAFGRRTSNKYETYNIPDESNVCVEVELVDVEDGTKLKNCYGKTVTREIVKLANSNVGNQGERVSLPLTTKSFMFVKLEGYKINGEEEEKEVFLPETVLPFTPSFNNWGTFENGKIEYPIPRTLGPLLKALMEGDHVLFTLSGISAFREDVDVNGVQIKAEESVKFLVCVEEVEELYDPFILSLDEKVKLGDRRLEQGLIYFNNGYYEAAMCKFTRVREYLWDAKSFLKKVPDDLGLEADYRLYIGLCKLAELYWKLPEMPVKESIKYCSDAITLLEDMKPIKYKAFALFQHGRVPIMEAYRLRALLYKEVRKEHDLAREDLSRALELTDDCIAWMENSIKEALMLELELEDGKKSEGTGDRKKLLEELAELRFKMEEELTQTRKMELIAKKKLKYVPPK